MKPDSSRINESLCELRMLKLSKKAIVLCRIKHVIFLYHFCTFSFGLSFVVEYRITYVMVKCITENVVKRNTIVPPYYIPR